jgi:hypothetical protein
MKIFYTVRDIEDMHAAGVVEIELHDDVVLTDVAREKAISLGMHLNPVAQGAAQRQGPAMPRASATPQAKSRPSGGGSAPPPPAASAASQARPQSDSGAASSPDLVMKIKAAVVARLGTDKYNDLLDRIIPQVLAKIK